MSSQTNALALVKDRPVAVAPPSARFEGEQLNNVQRLGNILAASGYFSDVRDMAQAAVKVMAGDELGIAPVAAVMGIHIIKGKVTLSANLIAAQVRRHGYNYKHVQFDTTGCTLQFFGKNGELLGDSSFTEADAKSAGVYNDMYKKFPRNMYFSRAISNGAKWYCPEVMSGLPVYVSEELGAKVDGDGEIIDLPDTGSHQPNTKEAANYVAEQKLATMLAETDARKNAKPAAVAEVVSPAVQALWARMRDIRTTLEVFAELKAQLTKAYGDDEGPHVYYAALTRQGVEHANQFKSTKPARIASKEMLESLTKRPAPSSVDSLEITDDDLPAELFGAAE